MMAFDSPVSLESPRFRRMLLRVVLVPLGLMTLVAALLAIQIGHLMRDSALVAHADAVIAQTDEVHALTVDLETGLRGYLITGDAAFLQPYTRALAVIGERSAELSRRTAGQPAQHARVAELNRRRADWLGYAADQLARRRAGGDYTTVANEARGKQMMDDMRAVFAALLRDETALRDARVADAATASWWTFALVALVAIAGGGTLAVTARHQVLDVVRTYATAIGAARDANTQLERRVAERTAALNAANAQLGETNQELEAFAYSISHDLRAPMRHISGFAELLMGSLGPALSVDDAENLATIRDTARLAGRMVDDLLGFSRVGRVALSRQTVDLDEIVQRCRRELGPDTAGRNIAWTYRPIPPVLGDPALLRMAVRNLLANAVKYTGRRDAATVDVGPAEWPATEAGPAPAGCVVFAVTDNGVGFDMAYAPKLFGVFQRLHRAEDFDGTGIGLANVKRIIQRMGGSVWARGVPEVGATFFVCLPAATPTDGATAG